MDNIQHLLDKVRSPRVQITYDVETNGAKVVKELPYIIGIIADVAGETDKPIDYFQRKFINLKMENINQVMEFLGVKLNLSVLKYNTNDDNNENIDFSLNFKNIKDFHPDNIINNWDLLFNLKKNLISLKDLKRKVSSNNIFMNSLIKSLKDNTLNSSMMVSQEETINNENNPSKKGK
jgi:type VI secretion system protein ImpB